MMQRQLNTIPQLMKQHLHCLDVSKSIQHSGIQAKDKRNHSKLQSFQLYHCSSRTWCPCHFINRAKCCHQEQCPMRCGYPKYVSCLESLTCYHLSLLLIQQKGMLIFWKLVERTHEKFPQATY